MFNVQSERIARIFCLVAAIALGASMAAAQQNRKGTSAPLFTVLAPRAASSTASVRFTPLAAGLLTPGPRFLSNQTQDADSAPGYVRPSFHQRFHNYAVHTYGPIKMTELAIGSAISQADDVPPEWHQGWGAYGKRFVSDVGSTAVGGTTEFALAEALRVDTKYYPCECKGIWPRVGHALKSAITARAGADGHRVFSVPALVGPYAGAFSTLAWYPSRYGPKDGFRTGNYDLLDSVGESIALEFLLPVLHKFHLR